MIELLLVVGALVGFAMLVQRIRRLEAQVEALHDRLVADYASPLERAAPPIPQAAPAADRVEQPDPGEPEALPPVVARPEAVDPPPPPAIPDPLPVWPPVEEGPEAGRPGFESLVGGRLPIWTGGAALVVAGFFLVRYSIESGLLGPAVRSLLAALFSVALVAASEVARRLPATRGDARIGQALAGAGIASAYGTLYIAAAQYALVGALAAFALMLAITGIALFLALRHGPPTAVMALIGGFAAPLVAGFDAAGIGALLVYLALFTAALFALAAHRGWTWLAIGAVVAGFGWANLIVVLLEGRDATGVAAFVVALAVGATLALPRTGAERPWLRVAPLVAGLVQLLVLVPTLDFGVVAWSFYLVLSAACLVLAWRQAVLMPAALAAPVLVLVLLGGAFAQDAPTAPWAAVAIAALFGGAGFVLSRTDRRWPWVALAGIGGPVLVAYASAADRLSLGGWAGLQGLAALAAFALAARHRDRAGQGDSGLVEGIVAGAALAAIAVATPLGWGWAPLPAAAALAGVAFAARRLAEPRLAGWTPAFLAALVVLAAAPLGDWLDAAVWATLEGRAIFNRLPALLDALRSFAVPAAGAAAAWWWLADAPRPRRAALLLATGFGLLALHVLVKQPLAVATDVDHIARGFPDRALVTLTIFALGWLGSRQAETQRLGDALMAVALTRILWFDLGVASPLAIDQAVGGVPVANAAVALPAIIAATLLLPPQRRRWAAVGLAMMALAVAATVRQAAHGTYLTGPIGTGENWGYSAAFLLLSLAWLWAGIAKVDRALRIAGLGLLTAVTLKVFLVDAAALEGLLRIVSFLGLGIALIGIGWAYGKVLAPRAAS